MQLSESRELTNDEMTGFTGGKWKWSVIYLLIEAGEWWNGEMGGSGSNIDSSNYQDYVNSNDPLM